jgi:predicted O-methyltransferase YrrM
MQRSALINLVRQLPAAGRDRFLRRSFNIWQFLGFHVTPNHYYEPIPDTRRIPKSLWSQLSALPGVDMRDQAQVALLASLSAFRNEYAAFPLDRTGNMHDYYVNNRRFESVDGEVLYSLIRQLQPKRLVEVGSGASTLLSAKAVLRNSAEGHLCDFTSIDPYPPDELRHNLTGLSRLVVKPVQGVPLDVFTALEGGDVLFIDSSHVVRIGGDVLFEFLEVFPRLRKGVLIHIHDIFLPSEYPEKWVFKEKRFWSEQYLLQAFLSFNDAFEVVWASSYMHLRHPEMLEEAFPSYRRDRRWPGSFWMRKIR